MDRLNLVMFGRTSANGQAAIKGIGMEYAFKALLIRQREEQLIAVGIIYLDNVIAPPRFLARN